MIKPFPNTIIQAIALILSCGVLMVPFVGLTVFYADTVNADIVNAMLFITYCIVVIIVVLIKNKRRKAQQAYNFKLFAPSLIPLIILVPSVFQVGVCIPLIDVVSSQLGAKNPLINPLDNYAFFFGSLILAPLFEEIIFRGIILRGFLSTYNFKKAIVFSAVLFAIIHVQPSQMFSALIMGLFLGWIYYETESLGNCILIHLSANAASMVANYMLFKHSYSLNTVYGSFTFYIIVVSIGVLLGFIYMLNRQICKNKTQNLGVERIEMLSASSD